MPVAIESLPDERLAPAVEAAAYFLVAEVVKRSAAAASTVRAERADGRLQRRGRERRHARRRPRRARGPHRRARRRARGRRGRPATRRFARRSRAGRDRRRRDAPARGLARLLADAGFDVVGKAATAAELLRAVRLTEPDVAIVDIKMPPTHTDEGLVAAQEIRAVASRRRRARPLALPRVRYAMRLLEEHPERVGYLLKERVSDIAVLADALRRIAEGECVLDPTIVAAAASAGRASRARSTSSPTASARCSR